MPTVVIVGAQWGDEGKGKIVDFCTEYADVVVRYAGGPDAGHTPVVGDHQVIVRPNPGRHLPPRTHCVLGERNVNEPEVLVSRIGRVGRPRPLPDAAPFLTDRA